MQDPAGFAAAMGVSLAAGDRSGECGHVHSAVGGRVELQCLRGDKEGRRVVCAEGRVQLMKRLAQAVACGLVRLVGPEQPGEHLAAVGAIGFRGQVGQ